MCMIPVNTGRNKKTLCEPHLCAPYTTVEFKVNSNAPRRTFFYLPQLKKDLKI